MLGEGLAEDMQWLASLLPRSITINHVKHKPLYRKQNPASRKLFKDSIYAEHFLPIWYKENGLHIGFEPNKSIEVTGKDPICLLKILQPLFQQKIPPLAPDRLIRLSIDKTRAFELLHKVTSVRNNYRINSIGYRYR
jgi:hypothetical protein